MAEAKSTIGHRTRDITGQTFFKLVVVSFDRLDSQRRSFWNCRCDCGGTISARSDSLAAGTTVSCGCENRRRVSEATRKHGQAWPARTPEYSIWCAMLQRCRNPKCKAFPDYGGRGIHVCERWSTFANFIADVGTRPSKAHSIDRINNDGSYEPGNVRWATTSQQAANKRKQKPPRTAKLLNFNGESLTIAGWAMRSGVTPECLRSRLHLGWSLERALAANGPLKGTGECF